MTCLGDVVAALVDGELDDAARERAHRHLAHCAGCRAEVDAQRRLKSRLSGATVDDPAPSDALTARLLGLTAGAVPLPPLPTGGPRSPRPMTGPTSRGPGRRAPRRRAAVGSALVALGLTAALALGGQPASAPSTPLDPATDAFVVDFVSTSSGGGAGGGR